MEFRNTLPSDGRAHQHRHGAAPAGGQQSGLDAVLLLLRGVMLPQPVTQFGPGHFVLELGLRKKRAQKTVLVQQHGLVECHVGDADGAFLAQRGIVAVDGDLVNRARLVRIQAAMAVVITDRVGCADISDPAGFDQRNQPSVVLSGNGHRPRHGQGQRASQANGAVQNLVNAPQTCAPKRRQGMPE